MKNLGTPKAARLFHLGEEPYNLSHLHTDKKVKDLFNPGEEETALPWAWKVAAGNLYKLSRDQFRELYYCTACLLDAAYAQEAANNLQSGYLNTFNKVLIPQGRYLTNMNVPFPRAGLDGTGTFAYYGTGGDQGYYTTELVMTEQWIDRFDEQIVLGSPNLHYPAGEFNSYNEGYEVTRIRLTGPGPISDGRRRIGIAFGRSGETSCWHLIKSDYFDIGILAREGVPMAGGVCSVFGNRIAGFAGLGCAMASMSIDVISGDRNGSLIRLADGYGKHGGGNLDIKLAKGEDANPQGGGKYGSQIIAWLAGQFHVTIANVRPSCDQRLNDAMFVVDPVIHLKPDWGQQGSYLRASGQGFHYNTLLHNLSAQTRRVARPDYKSWAFEWYAEEDRFATNAPGDWIPKAAGSAPLASLDRNPNTGQAIGTWNDATGSPARVDNLGTEAPAPTPEPGPTQPPVEPPTEPPTNPVPGARKYKGGPFNVDRPTFSVPVSVPRVTKAVITLRADTFNYGRILGTGQSQPSLQLYPDGHLYYDHKRVSAAKLVKGQMQTVEVALPDITVTCLFQTDPSQGGAQLGLFESIELF